MRVRSTTTGAFSSANVRQKKTRTCGGSISTTSTTTYSGVVTTKTIEDVEVPRFHHLLKCGRFLPLNPVTIVTTVETRTPGDIAEHYRKPDSCTLSPWTGLDTGPSQMADNFTLDEGYPSEAVISACVNEAVANSRSAAWDVLTFLAEFKQLQELFRTNLGRVTEFGTRAANFARRVQSKDRAKAFAEKWLEYRYGWMPAIYDVGDALNAIQNDRVGWVRGRGTQTVNVSDSASWNVVEAAYQTATFSETITGTHVVRGWAAADMGNSPFTDFGFDPLVTAWEIVPYSFVADWFIQVGTWINAVSPFQPGKVLGSCASIKSEITREISVNRSWHRDGTTNHWGAGSGGSRRVEMTRYIRFPHDTSLPGWNPRITPERIIDGIALAIAAKLGVKRLLR